MDRYVQTIVVDEDRFARCDGCNCEIPAVCIENYFDFEIDSRIFCGQCGVSTEISLTFICSAVPDKDDFSIELDRFVRYGEFSQYILTAEETAWIGKYDVCLRDTTTVIEQDAIMCDGDEFILLPKDDTLRYNFSSPLTNKSYWDALPGPIKANVFLDAEKEGKYMCYLPELETAKTLTNVLEQNEMSLDEYKSIEACIAAFQKLFKGDLKLPRLSLCGILITEKCGFKVLPFANESGVDTVYNNFDLLMQDMLAKNTQSPFVGRALRKKWQQLFGEGFGRNKKRKCE